MDIDTILLLGILLMLIVDYAKDSVTLQKMRRNVPHWIKDKVNGLFNR